MWIRNKKHGGKFEVSPSDFETKIVAKGLAEKYEIIEDSKPVELKRLSVEVHKRKNKNQQ